MTEAVQRADRLREVQRVVQRQDEHRAAQPQLFGARRGIGECLERRQDAGRADHLLLHPAAIEHPELLDAAKVSAEGLSSKRLSRAYCGIDIANRTDRDLIAQTIRGWLARVEPQPVIRDQTRHLQTCQRAHLQVLHEG